MPKEEGITHLHSYYGQPREQNQCLGEDTDYQACQESYKNLRVSDLVLTP